MAEETVAPLSAAVILSSDQERLRGDDFFTVYANNLGISFSSWDVALIFGEIIGQKDDGKPVIEEICKVILTREFAKVVSQVLALNLAAYEKQFGEIELRHFQLQPQASSVDFGALKQ